MTLRLLTVTLLWAGCFPLITVGLELAPHIAFATMRAVLAGICLIVLGISLKRPLPKGRRAWLLIAVTGLGATTLGFLGMFHAAEFVSPGIATVIANAQPLLAVVLAFLFLTEKLNIGAATGLVVGFVGILTIASPGVFSGDVKGYTLGIAYVALAAIGVAIGNVAIKSLSSRVDGVMAMGFQLIIGSLPLGFISLISEDTSSIKWSAEFLMILAILAIFGTSLVFWLWFSALKIVALNRANAFTFLVPLFGLVIGALFFGERLGWIEIFGAILVLMGIILVHRSKFDAA